MSDHASGGNAVPLRLATRGSDLAMWQARNAAALLGAGAAPVIIESKGDRDRVTDLARFGSIGIFTAEVDRAVLDGRADVGVHSLKDMTTTLQDGVVLAGVLERGLVEDVLVSRGGMTLEQMPKGSRIGSGSLRRGAMLRATRPDIEVVQIRGNVATRIEKVTCGDVDATVLARAGIVRLGLDQHIAEVLDTGRFLPAVGQGIVGLTCRADDQQTIDAIAGSARDAATWTCAQAERTFLRAMKGGCNAPVGGHASIEGGRLTLKGRVLSIDGQQSIDGCVEGPAHEAEALALRLASDLESKGGAALIEAARASGAAAAPPENAP